jgi:hypothetical protein
LRILEKTVKNFLPGRTRLATGPNRLGRVLGLVLAFFDYDYDYDDGGLKPAPVEPQARRYNVGGAVPGLWPDGERGRFCHHLPWSGEHRDKPVDPLAGVRNHRVG